VIAAAGTMRIGVLGPLEVTDAAGRPVRVGGQRVRALLILLALDAGRPVPARALIDRLWPGDQPVDAANALQSLVSRLRVALRQAGLPDSVLESSPAGYRLAVPPDAVDAIEFEERAKAGARALARGEAAEAARLLRAALGRWRGDPLTDVADDEFASAPAARLTELRAAATLNRIEADLALGAADPALVGELRELTAADPFAERPVALLMRVLAAAGRQAEALAVYRQARDRLADQLGVDPSAQLERTHLAILRQEIKAAPVTGPGTDAGPAPGPARMRRPPTSFVGREEDVAGVLKRLAAERLVTLTGPGGVGKTRLAAESAARLGTPCWLAELAPVTDPAELPYTVLDALGLRERIIAKRAADPAADGIDQLCGALARRELVLILDNCEHVIDAAAELTARLLSDCPQVRVLATSREPLRIPGETLQVVAPLASSPAVRLFTDRAAAVVPDFAITADNAADVARICRALDGMPLAIELAAPWLRTLSAAQLATRLDDRFALLTGGSRTALPRHKTLRAVVDWSWQLLSARERALARRLAIFPGGATMAAAEQVCGWHAAGEVLPPAAVLPTLSGLVGKSLLARVDVPDGGEPRYRMLETVRAYGLERLAEAGEEHAAREAFARYFLGFAETADPLLRGPEQATWFRAVNADQDNILAALRAVVATRDVVSALLFVRALGYYWVQRALGEADALTREVLQLPAPPLTRELAEARVICAVLAAGKSWEIELVRDTLSAALAELAQFGDNHDAFHPLVAMAEPLVLQYDGATDLAQRRYERYASARDPWLRAMGEINLSANGIALGQLDGAEGRGRAGLAGFRALGEKWGVAVALTQLTEFTELRADHAASIAAMEEAVRIGRELGVWGDLTYVESRLAVIRARSGDLAGARAEMDAVQRACQVRGGADTDRWALFLTAELAWLAGDFPGVVNCCADVLAVIADHEARWWQSLRAQVKARLALALLNLGDRAGCRAQLTEALDAAASWQEHPALAAVLDASAAYVLADVTAPASAPAPDSAAVEAPALAPAPDSAAAAAASRLLGAAHAIRGAFDESSLDAPRARELSRHALGGDAFAAAYASTSGITYPEAVTLGRQSLA
jgi:predicted ATPase/DNA-binding SARP family transcriptional activator